MTTERLNIHLLLYVLPLVNFTSLYLLLETERYQVEVNFFRQLSFSSQPQEMGRTRFTYLSLMVLSSDLLVN